MSAALAQWRGMRSGLIVLTFSLLHFQAASGREGSPLFYQARKGDSLESILQRLQLLPLQGKRGSLNETLRLNPGEIHQNGNLLWEGAQVVLPVHFLPQSEAYCVDPLRNEVVFTPDGRSRASPLIQKICQGSAAAMAGAAPRPTGVTGVRRPASSSSAASVIAGQAPPDSVREDPGREKNSGLFKRHSAWSLSGGARFIRLDGVDRFSGDQATLVSSLSPEAHASWSFLWTERFRTQGEISFLHLTMNEPTMRTLENPAQWDWALGLSAVYRMFHPFEIGAGLQIGQEIFYRATSASSVRLDAVPVPALRLFSHWSLMDAEPLGISLDLGTRVYVPTRVDFYTTSLSLAYGIKMNFEHQLPKGGPSLTLGALYERSSLSSTLVVQSKTELGLDLSVRWRIEN